jgi:hypothetical protein
VLACIGSQPAKQTNPGRRAPTIIITRTLALCLFASVVISINLISNKQTSVPFNVLIEIDFEPHVCWLWLEVVHESLQRRRSFLFVSSIDLALAALGRVYSVPGKLVHRRPHRDPEETLGHNNPSSSYLLQAALPRARMLHLILPLELPVHS